MTTTKNVRTKSAAPLRIARDATKRAKRTDHDSPRGLVCGEQLQAYRDAQFFDSLGEQMILALDLEYDDEMELAYVVNRDGFWSEIARRAAALAA
jgi:hypothetical protein